MQPYRTPGERPDYEQKTSRIAVVGEYFTWFRLVCCVLGTIVLYLGWLGPGESFCGWVVIMNAWPCLMFYRKDM